MCCACCTGCCIRIHYVYSQSMDFARVLQATRKYMHVVICLYVIHHHDHNKYTLAKLRFHTTCKLLHHHNAAAATKMWYSHSRFRCTLDTFYVERTYRYCAHIYTFILSLYSCRYCVDDKQHS